MELCRAIAVAVLGPEGRVEFRLYEAPKAYDRVRRGTDELSFLSGTEIADQKLEADVLPGPMAFVTTIGVMVPKGSTAHRLDELSHTTVCLMIGSIGQRALEHAAALLHLTIGRLPFEEDVEMLDAYNAGRCGAVVGEAPYLAEVRKYPGVQRRESRPLPQTLAADPIIVTTPRPDGAWGADVAWVMAALQLSDAPGGGSAGGAASLPPPGLRPRWRAEVTAAVGSYGAIIRRELAGRLGLAAGPYTLWPEGLLLPPAMR